MIYPFECEPCGTIRSVEAPAFSPPNCVNCSCGRPMQRIFGCQIDTSGCKDHDDIPEQHRVQRRCAPNHVRAEAAFQRDITEKRAMAAAGGNSGSFRMSHSVPADLFHGKIRETGDKNYWSDPKNLARHSSTKVS